METPTKEIYLKEDLALDVAASRKNLNGVHQLSGPVRSIVITKSSSSSAQVYAYFVQTNERIFLKPGVPVSFKEPRNGCVLEWDAQTGVTISVQYSADTHLNHYEFSVDSIGKTFQSGGTSFDEGLKTVTTSEVLLFDANDSRVMLTIEHRGSTVLRWGKAGSCLGYLYPGQVMKWNLTAGLYFKSESASETDALYWLEQEK